MQTETMWYVCLADGFEFYAVPDGVGNLICPDTLDKRAFAAENLVQVIIEENGTQSIYEDQILRTFYHQEDGSTFFRIGDKTEIETINEMNDMFIDLLSEQEYKLCLIELGLI